MIRRNNYSVYKRTGRPFWFVSYYCPARGKRIHESTQWRIDVASGHKHALTYAANKGQAAQAFIGVVKHEIWSAWVDKFLLERYRGEGKKKTLDRYQGVWAWLRLFFENEKIHHPKLVDYNTALKYMTWRRSVKRHCGKTIGKNTAILEVKVLGIIMAEAVRRGFTSVNPCVRMDLKRDPVAEKPEMTDAQISLIRKLVADIEGGLPLAQQWMTTSFEFALHHGCRISETQIPMTAIDFDRSTVRITAKGRNGVAKVYTNRIHPAILPRLKAIRDTGAESTCVLPVMASKVWHTLFKGNDELKNLCFHCTRVTVITRFARAGVPIQQAMAYVGHASQTVHRIYQRLKADDLTLCSAALSYS